MVISGHRTRLVAIEGGGLPPGGAVRHFVTVELETDVGLRGIGYTGFATPAMTGALKAAVDGLIEHAVGADPTRGEALHGQLLTLGGNGAPAGIATRAVAAIDVALWDLRAQAAQEPLHRFLGGFRDRVPTYGSAHLWRTYDHPQLAAAAAELAAQGFRAVKLRLGGERSGAAELARVRVVREAIGPDVELMVDINQGWSVDESIRVGRGLAEYGVYWLEDPVAH